MLEPLAAERTLTLGRFFAHLPANTHDEFENQRWHPEHGMECLLSLLQEAMYLSCDTYLSPALQHNSLPASCKRLLYILREHKFPSIAAELRHDSTSLGIPCQKIAAYYV